MLGMRGTLVAWKGRASKVYDAEELERRTAAKKGPKPVESKLKQSKVSLHRRRCYCVDLGSCIFFSDVEVVLCQETAPAAGLQLSLLAMPAKNSECKAYMKSRHCNVGRLLGLFHYLAL